MSLCIPFISQIIQNLWSIFYKWKMISHVITHYSHVTAHNSHASFPHVNEYLHSHGVFAARGSVIRCALSLDTNKRWQIKYSPPSIFARPHEEKSLFFLQGSMYHKLWQDDVIFWKYVFIAMHWCISRWRFSNINCTSICNNVMLDTKLSVYSLHNCLHGLDFSSIHLVYFTWSLYGVEAWGMRWRCRAF